MLVLGRPGPGLLLGGKSRASGRAGSVWTDGHGPGITLLVLGAEITFKHKSFSVPTSTSPFPA